jgi:transcriptional regulator with XRE-family HTH domain
MSALRKRLENIREKSGITSREVAQLLKTTPQTVSRWQSGESSPHPKSLERLLALDWLAEQLAQFYTPDEAKLWLFSRHQLLSGERPADRIAEGRVEDVLKLIDQLQSSAYL